MLNKKLQKNFTIADNRIMQLQGLSFEARGLYFYMLSLPDDWEFSEVRLAKNGGIGIDKCKRILKELFCIGLLKREFIHNEKGHKKSVYTLYDFSTLENPTLENPTLENPMNNKEINNNKELNLNKEIYIQKEKIKKEKDCVSLFASFDFENKNADSVSKAKENKDDLERLESEFNQIWELYPKKQDKQSALNSYLKARKGSKIALNGKGNAKVAPQSFETILQGVKNYLRANRGVEIKFIKHLSTFLNQATYLDFQGEVNLNRRVGVIDDHEDYLNADKSIYIPK